MCHNVFRNTTLFWPNKKKKKKYEQEQQRGEQLRTSASLNESDENRTLSIRAMADTSIASLKLHQV
jgi:hypothetical protein